MTEQRKSPPNFDQAGLSGLRWLARCGIALSAYEGVASAVQAVAGDVSARHGIANISYETTGLILACAFATVMTEMKEHLARARSAATDEVKALASQLGTKNDNANGIPGSKKTTVLDRLMANATPTLGGLLAGVTAAGFLTSYALYGHPGGRILGIDAHGVHDENGVSMFLAFMSALVNGVTASAMIVGKDKEGVTSGPNGRHTDDPGADLANGQEARKAEVIELADYLKHARQPKVDRKFG